MTHNECKGCGGDADYTVIIAPQTTIRRCQDCLRDAETGATKLEDVTYWADVASLRTELRDLRKETT